MEQEPLRLTAKPLSPETWPDFETLFAKHNGVWGGCWCVYYLCGGAEFKQMEPEGRREFHRSLAFSGRARGVIAYEGQTPVGWCQFGPPDVLCQYDRGRVYPKLSIAREDRPQWRISCLFTDRHKRSRGVAIFTLHAALSEIARSGGGVTEAFPLDGPHTKHNVFSGSLDMYLREGFEAVTRLTQSRVLVRRRVEPAG